MIARIHKSMNEKDKGFTLIELLVVIIIIGILAAIAIPVFMNQRKKAVDSSLKSDLRTVANEMETAYTDDQAYPAGSGGPGTIKLTPSGTGATAVDVALSAGNTITVAVSGESYCLLAKAPTGKATQDWVYKSNAGGLQAKSVKTCA